MLINKEMNNLLYQQVQKTVEQKLSVKGSVPENCILYNPATSNVKFDSLIPRNSRSIIDEKTALAQKKALIENLLW